MNDRFFTFSPAALLLTSMLAMLLSPPSQAESIRIAVATNFAATFSQLKVSFESGSRHSLEVSSASTGTLFAQINNGAPFDILLSADQARPAMLIDRGLAKAPAISYAHGQLALWHPQISTVDTQDWIQQLNQGEYRNLAIANPLLAPYGEATEDIISHLVNADEITEKLVFGQNIGQAYAMVASRNAELGFVALSQLKQPNSPAITPDQYTVIPNSFHSPIIQDGVILSDNPAAAEFLSFLQSDLARSIILNAGYQVPEA